MDRRIHAGRSSAFCLFATLTTWLTASVPRNCQYLHTLDASTTKPGRGGWDPHTGMPHAFRAKSQTFGVSCLILSRFESLPLRQFSFFDRARRMPEFACRGAN